MNFFQLLNSIIVLALLFVIVSGTPSLQRHNDNNYSQANDLSFVGKEPNEDNLEDHANLLSSILAENNLSEEVVNEDQDQKEFVHRQRRAAITFNGGRSTNSNSAREAFRNAKDQNGIGRSQSPTRQYYIPDKHNPNQGLRQYDFINHYGQKISIRKDIPIKYPDGGQQGPHYNAGPSGGKLRQHHNFPLRRNG
ncbi:unnamed protein product [Adineta steineri]|uniref:Uncharacterized protein n=1 Tax=Adineta steineri TaxID=433720 RepID=A0A815IC36_9BILA|nr:unnamed protein product [Adineta steineri]